MRHYAIIDIGSSSIKLSVAKFEDNQKYAIIFHKKFSEVKLAKGVDSSGMLMPEIIEKSLGVVNRCLEYLNSYPVDKVKIISTSAIRKASNRDVFIEKVQKMTGVGLEVISEKREAEIFFKGVIDDFPSGKKYAAANFGGLSTELTVGSKDHIDQLMNFPFGAVSLREKFLHSDPPTNQEHSLMVNFIKEHIGKALNGTNDDFLFIYTGGELEYILAAGCPSEESSLSYTHPKAVKLSEFRKFSDKIRKMKNENLNSMMPDTPGWMDGAIASNAVVIALAEKLGAACMIPSNKNITDGLLIDLAKNY